MTDRISDTLCGYLEKLLVMQDKEIKGLKEERDKAFVELAAYKANMQPLHQLIDLLEEDVNNAELEALALKDQRDINHRRLEEKDKIIIGLREDLEGAERFIERLETTNIALVIQAAESEDRADDERRGRLQLVMRM